MATPADAERSNAEAPPPAGRPSSYRPRSLEECLSTLRSYFDAYAPVRDRWRVAGYHDLVERYYRHYIPEGSSVLEIGSGTGELLAALLPSRGVGVDLSEQMTARARAKFPQENLQFLTQPVERLDLPGQTFDYIILSDALVFFYDILAGLEALRAHCHARTRIIINTHSRLWQPILGILERLGLKYPQPVLNWVTSEDVVNLLRLAGFEVVTHEERILLPAKIPVLSTLCNVVLAPFAPFRWLCLTNWIVARLPLPLDDALGVSIVCPCRNEAGNIQPLIERLPDMACPWELIFVEGHSQDDTLDACRRAIEAFPGRDICVLEQTGRGKGDAVRLGFSRAKQPILAILDADMSVAPEDLPRFVAVLRSGRVELVNGSRLVYPMESAAMRFLNLVGNKFFSLTISFLLGQAIKDTLCGTKVLLKDDYERLARRRDYFGTLDPFGDFDLLLGAARLGLAIADLPVRYRDRTYGTTNISRFLHGWLLLRMCGVALLRLKMR